MNDAKADIFAAIAKARPAKTKDAAAIAAQANELATAMREFRPPAEGDDLVELFMARASSEKVGASIDRVDALAALPGVVARYSRANGLGIDFSLQPDARLERLDWSAMKPSREIAPDTMLAVGIARSGVAETGSLVFHSDPEAPTLFAFLPDHHIVAIEAQKIRRWLEDYAIAEIGTAAPRNVNLVTGASGTTDIEGVLVRGAHGPRSLHIVIIGNAC
jgi:L-lactate dehydrogenase complex protein LldG